MNRKPFAPVLVRKSARVLKSARRDLADGDYDSAVNRSYYAMFNIARAALLGGGVGEDKLPRTHNGVIEAFRQHAIRSGKIDLQLAGELSRTESLRIKADYTDLEIEPNVATAVVEKAQLFVRTVERAFSLGESLSGRGYEDDHHPTPDDKVSEVGAPSNAERQESGIQPISLEDIRRQARENWLRLRAGEGASQSGKASDCDRQTHIDQSQTLDDFDD